MTEAIQRALAHYSVTPLLPDLPLAPKPVKVKRVSTDVWNFAAPLGCLLTVPATLIFAGLAGRGWKLPIVPGAIIAFPIAFAIVLSIEFSKTSARQAKADDERRQQWEREKSDARERSDREGRDTIAELRSILVASAEMRDGLFVFLEIAQAELDRASAEYNARVIPTFWDADERAAAALGQYDRLLRQLINNAQRYYKKLELREHTFPPFPYVSVDLPSEEDMVIRFKQVVRVGHSDYQFANIWEQRRTREAIETGFGSLERAVREVGCNIVATLADIQMTLDAGFDRLVESHVSSGAAIRSTLDSVAQAADTQRREVLEVLRNQNSKLDNIQWRRKPLGSKYLRE